MDDPKFKNLIWSDYSMLLEDYSITIKARSITLTCRILEGFVWDGSGSLVKGCLIPILVHSWAYSCPFYVCGFRLSRKDWDKILLKLMKDTKINWLRRTFIYYLVRIFGKKHWMGELR